jgi:hypothetical protein
MRQARNMLFGQLALLPMPRELQRCASASLHGKRGDEGLSEVCVRRKAAWRLRRAPWLFSVKAVPLEHCPQRAQLCGLGYIQGSRAFFDQHPFQVISAADCVARNSMGIAVTYSASWAAAQMCPSVRVIQETFVTCTWPGQKAVHTSPARAHEIQYQANGARTLYGSR